MWEKNGKIVFLLFSLYKKLLENYHFICYMFLYVDIYHFICFFLGLLKKKVTSVFKVRSDVGFWNRAVFQTVNKLAHESFHLKDLERLLFRIKKDFEANLQRTESHQTVTIRLATPTVDNKTTVCRENKKCLQASELITHSTRLDFAGTAKISEEERVTYICNIINFFILYFNYSFDCKINHIL